MSYRYTPRGWTYQGMDQAEELQAVEEMERRQNLSKYEQARSSVAAHEWGMQRALDTLEDHENRRRHPPLPLLPKLPLPPLLGGRRGLRGVSFHGRAGGGPARHPPCRACSPPSEAAITLLGR
jgi:hypothetical protein